MIWKNKFSLCRKEPLKTGYRLINVEPREAFTMNELSIWMENSRAFAQSNGCIVASENQIKKNAIGIESFP